MSRSVYIDNLKFFLIMLVVIGHFLDQIIPVSTTAKGIWLFISSFHMPLFIFINGYLGKRIIQSYSRVKNRVLFFLVLYFLLKILIFFTKIMFCKNPSFSFFTEDGIPWYLYAVAFFYGITYLLKSFDLRWILVMAFVLGTMCGYDVSIGDKYVLSRIFVFYPYFLIGYMMPENSLLKIENLSKKKWMCSILLCLILITCIVYLEKLYFLRPLFTGRNAYDAVDIPFYLGGIYRIFVYLISGLISILILGAIPNISLGHISRFGCRTLSVYFWHRPILYVLAYTRVDSLLREFGGEEAGKVCWILLAIFLTLILSLKVFSIPLNYISQKFQHN